MKKLLITLLTVVGMAMPVIANATVNAPWNATSTDKGGVQPTRINGNDPFVNADHYIATSTTVTSKLPILDILQTLTMNNGATTIGTNAGLVYPNLNAMTDSASNFYYPGNNYLFSDNSDQIYYGIAGAHVLTNNVGTLFYSNGENLADVSGNLYYGNGQSLADASNNLYYGSGHVFFNGSGQNLNYYNGSQFVDNNSNIFLNGGGTVYDNTGSPGTNGQCLTTTSTHDVWNNCISAANSSKWATSTNGLAIYPNGGNSIAVIIGRSATTTNSLLEVNGTTTALVFTATSTTGTSNFAGKLESQTYLYPNGTKMVDSVGGGILYYGSNFGQLTDGVGDLFINSGGQFNLAGTAGTKGQLVTSQGTGGGTIWQDPVWFINANSTKIYENAYNFVGIGTTSPYATLSVVGQVVGAYFTATTSTASQFPYASTTMISATTASTTNLNIGVFGSTQCLQANSSGVVSGTGSACASSSGTVNTGVFGQATFYGANGNTVSGTSTLVFGTTTTDANNVGIGTTTPWKKLSVNGDIAFTGMIYNPAPCFAFTPMSGQVCFTESGNSVTQQFLSSAALNDGVLMSYDTTGSNDFTINNTETGPDILSTGGVERMRILFNGNVGIGTTSPYANLSVVGSSGVVADHYTSTSTANASSFYGGLKLYNTATEASAGDILMATDENNGGVNSTYITNDTTNRRVYIGNAAHPAYSLNLSDTTIGIEGLNTLSLGTPNGYITWANGTDDMVGRTGIPMQEHAYWSWAWLSGDRTVLGNNTFTNEGISGPNYQFFGGDNASAGNLTTPVMKIYGALGQTGDILQIASTTAASTYSVLSEFTKNGALGLGTTTPYAELSVQASTGDIFAMATSTGNAVGGEDSSGHYWTSGPAPTVSSCGTGSPSIVGDDQGGTITTGTAATSCTITFSSAWTKTPYVKTAQDNSLVITATVTSLSTTAATFSISGAGLTGGTIWYGFGYHK